MLPFATYTHEQEQALRWASGRSSNEPLLIWQGAIRSGKTLGASIAFLLHSLRFPGQAFIIAGATVGAVERNVLPVIIDAANGLGLKVKRVRSRGTLEIGSGVFHVFGAPNERSQDVVQGLTAAGALLDEVALLPRSFVEQVQARCSVEGARRIYTLNPMGPYHWIKSELMAVSEHLFLKSRIQDNPAITEGILKTLSAGLTGYRYKRWIEGEWAASSGLVWPGFFEAEREYEEPKRGWELVECGVDWGMSAATAAVFVGRNKGKWWVIGEYYSEEELTGGQQAERIVHMGERLGCSRYVIDPSAGNLRLELVRKGGVGMLGNNDVLRGIDTVGGALEDGRLIPTEKGKMLRQEVSGYMWEEREDGLDKPVKGNDHACDALRYWAMSRLQVFDTRPIPKARAM